MENKQELQDELFIYLGFAPTPMLVDRVKRIDEDIIQAKEECEKHDAIYTKIWDSILNTRDKVILSRVIGITSSHEIAYNAAEAHQLLSAGAVNRMHRLIQDRDDVLRREYILNRTF